MAYGCSSTFHFVFVYSNLIKDKFKHVTFKRSIKSNQNFSPSIPKEITRRSQCLGQQSMGSFTIIGEPIYIQPCMLPKCHWFSPEPDGTLFFFFYAIYCQKQGELECWWVALARVVILLEGKISDCHVERGGWRHRANPPHHVGVYWLTEDAPTIGHLQWIFYPI